MLRALAGYFFGGPQEEASQQLECETKEVNDWLVVNMPDQPEANIELEEDNNDMELDDIDDVLWCLSNWFSPELTEKPNLDKEDYEEDIEPSITQIRLLYNQENEAQDFDISMSGIIEEMPREDWPLMPLIETSRYKKIIDEIQIRYFADCLKDSLPRSFWIAPKKGLPLRPLPLESLPQKQKAKELFQRLRERNGKKAAKNSDVTCPPVYSKTYVNHRHPSLSPPKTDLLQKIKELEPEQRATQNAMKKNLSRGQINRQNKNYIYDTSTKKNRRKNLQRNPSGANNNRKCCY